MTIQIGDQAPNFTLPNQHGEEIELQALRGKPVVLAFYPLSFSPTCTDELCELRDEFQIFEDSDATLLGVSVDSKFTQAAFSEAKEYQFDLLADFKPHGEVTKLYEAWLEEKGHGTRATYVIDADGVVIAKFVTSPGEMRPLADYKKALELVA
ncbi:MAG: peroxiredoxin [Microbacteriaceae bacterium]|jgi:peroxiredoxin|nr:peroxiredoxin [Microbacteriaceae bacterium]MDR9443556.1 peroxiredoxin [Microbacteriaceae bacterium]